MLSFRHFSKGAPGEVEILALAESRAATCAPAEAITRISDSSGCTSRTLSALITAPLGPFADACMLSYARTVGRTA